MSRTPRVLQALARQGLDVQQAEFGWSVRLTGNSSAPPAHIMLSPDLPLEGKAVSQLANLAILSHPSGGEVSAVRASPDFHPGDGGVPIGSALYTQGMVVPQAVGSDINCGMRLHATDLDVDRFLSEREAFVRRLQGDFFAGTRDLPQAPGVQRAMFVEGLPGWVRAQRESALGRAQLIDWDQVEAELERVHLGGRQAGSLRWVPDGLVVDRVMRDDGLATIGGGNHFVEVQMVEEVMDRHAAWHWGLKQGSVVFMIHSGSRAVGKVIGSAWHDRAREEWPDGVPWPSKGIFPIADPDLCRDYLEAEATAANYGFVNRELLAELVRLSLRELFGAVEAPLVYDVPHNITLPYEDGHLARKGSCPAEFGQPVIIPGSMGASSFVMRGTGNPEFLCSASHGAGRAVGRFNMKHKKKLGLEGVDCVTLRPERLLQEAPAAYKPIQPVIDIQVAAGVIEPVARLSPILTFKA